MLRKLTIAFSMIYLYLMLIASNCNPGDQVYCPNEPATDIDKSHAQFSPVAEKLFLQLHASDTCKGKGNLLLFAQYKTEDYNKDSLAFLHNGQKLLLRDDGVYPDAIKDDQEYTTLINIDTTELRNIYGADITASRGQELVSFIDFNGREVINTQSKQANTLSNRFDFDALRRGEKVELILQIPVLSEIRNKSLYIIDLKVVEDPTRVWIPNNANSNPNGAWSFKKIMEGLANTASTGISAEDFTLNWLTTWKNGGTVNGDNIDARNQNLQNFITNWPKANGKLDLTKSPFKLVAIVNRIDLMPNPVYNTEKKGGELRFVFIFLDPLSPNNAMSGADIIFEFGVNKTGSKLITYAKKWDDLKTLSVGSPEYNANLEALTNEIIGPNAEPTKPNGSNLNQLRTNELPLGGWQLQEFIIDATSKQLVNTTVKQEPSDKFNSGGDPTLLARLKQYVTDNETKILKNQYNIPDVFADGTSFLGAKSNYPNGGIWGTMAGGEITNQKTRFIISVNTCGGCHLQVTGTPFLHNNFNGGQAFGKETILSGFIKGTQSGLGTNDDHFNHNDPNTGSHTFNDLARRAKVLWAFTHSHPTLFGLQFNPVNMEH